MADQGVSNERKKELEQMDPFQAALVNGMAYATGHKKQLLMVLGAVVVVCLVFSTIIFSFKRSESTAAKLASEASQAYGQAYAQDNDPLAAYQAVSGEYESLLAEYKNTTAGRMAQVTYARICFDAKEYDKAYELYSKALDSVGKEAGMENLLLSALGNLAQIKGDPQKAKSYYLRIENGKSELLKDEARFSLALIYEGEKDMASSLKMYEKILAENPSSIYQAIAQARVNGAQ